MNRLSSWENGNVVKALIQKDLRGDITIARNAAEPNRLNVSLSSRRPLSMPDIRLWAAKSGIDRLRALGVQFAELVKSQAQPSLELARQAKRRSSPNSRVAWTSCSAVDKTRPYRSTDVSVGECNVTAAAGNILR